MNIYDQIKKVNEAELEKSLEQEPRNTRNRFVSSILGVISDIVHGSNASKEVKTQRQLDFLKHAPFYNQRGFRKSINDKASKNYPRRVLGEDLGVVTEEIPELHGSTGAPYPDYTENNPLMRYLWQGGQVAEGAHNQRVEKARKQGLLGDTSAEPKPVVPVPVRASTTSGPNNAVLEAVLDNIHKQGSPADKGILAGIDWRRLAQIMAGMPGAHMQNPYGGGSALTDFAISGQNVAAARSAAALEQEKLRSEERIAANKPLKPSPELSKLYSTIGSAKTGLENIDEMKKLLTQNISGTGVMGKAQDGINAFVNALNIPMPDSLKEDLNAGKKLDLVVDHLRTTLIESRIFGREASKQELAMIKTIIPGPGIFKHRNHMINAFNRIGEMLSRRMREATGQLKIYGAPVYDSLVNTDKAWSR